MAGVVLRSAYVRIGFPSEAVLVITDGQGIDCMEELDIFTDGKMDNLCKVIRRPGDINPITNIAYIGIQVSLRDKKKPEACQILP